MVPEPAFESYYGKQIIKTPTWKTPDVPLYLFLGGLGGASALLAEGAALSGNAELEHFTRVVAAGAAGAGAVARNLGVQPAYRRHSSARRPGCPRRPALVGPARRFPH